MVAPRFARGPKIRLPVPATHTTRYTRLTRRLRTRKLLLLSTTAFFFFAWTFLWPSSPSESTPYTEPQQKEDNLWESLEGVQVYTPRENDMGPPHTELRNLVVVAGHAIWLGGESKGVEDKEWTLAPFQKGEGPTYVKHIRAGVEAALKDKESLLVFSGGETEESAGPRAEGASYFELADALGLITEELLPRVTTEWFALDSYQNLLFSIARFHEYTSRYPERITVVSHDFKKYRFVGLHRKAIGFPEDKFEFVGIDPPVMETDAAEGVRKSEQRTAEEWEKDPYGCDERGNLAVKRRERGWSRRGDGYWDRCEEMRGLLTFCPVGGDKWYEGSLPWRKGKD